MSEDLLQQIQALQFTDKARAESLLIGLIRELFPLEVQSVLLRPLAVSLNSFNGFITLADGRQLFFKTHTEPDTVIGEYYHAAVLAEAGYPVIRPLYASTEVGKQLLIYDVVDDPSVFDLSWSIEMEQGGDLEALATAQTHSDEHLLACYLNTLAEQFADEHARAPIHQLFYHRLAGGRLDRFYGADQTITLPVGTFPLTEVRQQRWRINGQDYTLTLDALIARAVHVLRPAQAGAAIIGHGDAHNGNVFYRNGDLIYFDPAFAGRHHPLLDLTKPLFHNVFAMWMYHPVEKNQVTQLEMSIEDGQFIIEHNYALHPVRLMFFKSKVNQVLIPLVQHLHERDLLQPNWREYLKLALMCCPLLTMNLADAQRFPPAIAALGLAQAIEMGAESDSTRSMIDQTLDRIESTL